MGTSKGYLPPTGYLWPDVKREVTKMVRDNLSSDSINKAISSFAKALNNSTSVGSNTGKAIQSSGKAISFINSVKRYGFSETLDRFGLSFLKNENPDNLRKGLLKYFSDGGNEFYENISSQSMNELLREIFTGVNEVNEYEEILKNIDTADFIREFIIKFIQNCFFSNFTEKLLGLFDNLNKYEVAEKSIKTHIRNSIEKKYSLKKIQDIDWNGQEGNVILNDTYRNSLEILSAWSELGD